MTEPRGNIFLINRAPLDVTYQHTIDFTTADEQYAFWRSKSRYTLSEYSYVRRERRYIQVEKTFESLEGINYLFFQSRDTSKYFYCFVTDREYVNDETTRIYFEVDVLQSFMFDYSFKPSYISQAHVDRWDADHKPKYSRTDEGLNYGTEYITEAAYKIKPSAKQKHGFYFVFCSNHSNQIEAGAASEGTHIDYTPIPYDIYLVPSFEGGTKTGSHTFGTYSIYDTSGNSQSSSYTVAGFAKFQEFMAKSAFGTYVKQIIYVSYLPFAYEYGVGSATSSDSVGINLTTVNHAATTIKGDPSITLCKIRRIDSDTFNRTLASMDIFNGLEDHLPTSEMWSDLKANPYKYERDRRFESKLLCFPYRYNLFTDWRSLPSLIKNEYIFKDKITVKESVGFGFNMPRRYWLDGYRNDPEGREASITQVLPLEQAIISDAYYTYLLENKNQIAANLANTQANANIAIAGASAQAASGVASMLTGNIGGGLESISGAALKGAQAAQSVANLQRSENAKQADIRNMPDTIANPNDCNFAISDETKYLTFYRKAITCDFEEQLAQYWHMFGYKVNRVELPALRSRLRYNYIKTIGANIEGDVEANYLAAIKAIYDRGVTIWHYSTTNFFPLDYTYENPERNLL